MRCRNHLQPDLPETPQRPSHVQRLGHQHHPLDPRLAQDRRAVLGVLPGGAAVPFLPTHLYAVIVTQAVGHDLRLAGWRSVVQASGGEDRQAAGLGQTSGIAQAFAGHHPWLIGTPGRIAAFATGAENDDGIRPPGQARPLRAFQRRSLLEQACTPLHGYREAHQPEAAKAQHKAGHGQTRKASAQEERQAQQNQQQAWRHQDLLEEIAKRHRRLLERAPKPSGSTRGSTRLRTAEQLRAAGTAGQDALAATPEHRGAAECALQDLPSGGQARLDRSRHLSLRTRHFGRRALQQRQLLRCRMPATQPVHVLVEVSPDQLHFCTAEPTQLQFCRVFIAQSLGGIGLIQGQCETLQQPFIQTGPRQTCAMQLSHQSPQPGGNLPPSGEA
ncbi:hypothetical protein D9M71_313920 [compost metagenome]